MGAFASIAIVEGEREGEGEGVGFRKADGVAAGTVAMDDISGVTTSAGAKS